MKEVCNIVVKEAIKPLADHPLYVLNDGRYIATSSTRSRLELNAGYGNAMALHLYIVSHEKINVGNVYYNQVTGEVEVASAENREVWEETETFKECFLIIATTDKSYRPLAPYVPFSIVQRFAESKGNLSEFSI